MQKHSALVTMAGCMSVGLLTLTGITNGQAGAPSQMPNQAPVVAALPELPAGIAAKELNDQQDERSILASVTNAAVTKGGFDDLIERLTTADRKRIGDFAKQDFPQLDGRIEKLRADWQTKYGQALKLDEEFFRSFVMIREGEVVDQEQARTHWPVPATDRSPRDAALASSPSSGDYLIKGRNVAIVHLPTVSVATEMPNRMVPAPAPGGANRPAPPNAARAVNNASGLRVSLLHESIDDWRIDIPDAITGQQIYDALLSNLTRYDDNLKNWPADIKEASRQLSYEVLSAVYNTPREGGTSPTASAQYPRTMGQ